MTKPENINTAASKKRQAFVQIPMILCNCLLSKFQLDQSACGDRLDVTVTDASGKKIHETTVGTDPVKVARQQASDEYFEGVGFAVPSMRENLPSLSRYFEIPLDYSSVE